MLNSHGCALKEFWKVGGKVECDTVFLEDDCCDFDIRKTSWYRKIRQNKKCMTREPLAVVSLESGNYLFHVVNEQMCHAMLCRSETCSGWGGGEVLKPNGTLGFHVVHMLFSWIVQIPTLSKNIEIAMQANSLTKLLYIHMTIKLALWVSKKINKKAFLLQNFKNRN